MRYVCRNCGEQVTEFSETVVYNGMTQKFVNCRNCGRLNMATGVSIQLEGRDIGVLNDIPLPSVAPGSRIQPVEMIHSISDRTPEATIYEPYASVGEIILSQQTMSEMLDSILGRIDSIRYSQISISNSDCARAAYHNSGKKLNGYLAIVKEMGIDEKEAIKLFKRFLEEE